MDCVFNDCEIMLYIKDDLATHTITYPSKSHSVVYDEAIPNLVNFKPETNGVLANNFLLNTITEEVKFAVQSKSVACIRSWWIVLDNGQAVPKHSHRYQTNCRTISGTFYIDGNSCPLWIKEPAKSPRMIENLKGRLILFDGFVEHWTEPYKYDTTRYSIAFDFIIQDQPVCACKATQTCNRCVQNKLHQANITTYSGGTVKSAQGENYVIKNPYYRLIGGLFK